MPDKKVTPTAIGILILCLVGLVILAYYFIWTNIPSTSGALFASCILSAFVATVVALVVVSAEDAFDHAVYAFCEGWRKGLSGDDE